MKSIYLVIILVAGTIIMTCVMRWHGNSLTKTATTKAGIVALEFAKSKQRADEITNIWSNAGLQQHAINNTYIDFIFIFFYCLFLFSANWLFSIKQNSFIKKATQLIALVGLTAGLLDSIENFFLLKMLHLNISNSEAIITWWLAAIKFTFIAIAFLSILIHLILLPFRKPKPSSI